jgi:dienelactone hydrolase
MRRCAVLALLLLVCGCGGTQHEPRLTVEPGTALLDRDLHIRLTGVAAGERVTLEAREGWWIGRGVYRAEESGTVDPARDASIGGSYRGVSPMGLFWSMTSTATTGGPPWDGGTARLRAIVRGRVVGRASVHLVLRTDDTTVHTTFRRRDGFFGRYWAPTDTSKRRSAVLYVGGSEGALPDHGPQLLAEHGHPTLAVAYFDRAGLPDSLVRIRLEYFAGALRWLAARPGVDPHRIVVLGVSRGSEAALLLGVHFPELVHGVAALVPSSVVHAGLPAVPGERLEPAWTLHGRPIPFSDRRGETGGRAAIPVERIAGPIFVAGAAADGLWPSALYVQAMVDRLHAHGRTDVTALTYDGAGHGIGFAVPNVPIGTVIPSRYGTLSLGGTVEADARARADLWPKLLRFLAAL